MKSSRRRLSQPRYNLKDPNSTSPTLIYLVSRHSQVRFKYSTSKKVNPKYWIGDKAKESLHHPEHRDLNSFLMGLKLELSKILKYDPSIGHEDLKSRLDKWQGLDGRNESVPLFIDYMRDRITKINGKDERTISKYKTTLNKLIDYSNHYNVDLTFQDITLEFKNHFIDYLRTRDERGVSDNTLNKDTLVIKQFMEMSGLETVVVNGIRQSYHDMKDHKRKGFVVSRVPTTKHFLELNELHQLIEFKPDSYSYQIVKDYWVLMAFTGLRVSDIRRLSKNNIKSVGGVLSIDIETFKGRNTKKDTRVVIPLLPEAEAILDKYEYFMPKPLSEQKHNDYIKIIVEQAGINRIEEHKSSINGKRIKSNVKVAGKITSHSARYSFINFMINDYQISPIELSKITGQTLKVLMGYERGNKENNAARVHEKVLKNYKAMMDKRVVEKQVSQLTIESLESERQRLLLKLNALERQQNKNLKVVK